MLRPRQRHPDFVSAISEFPIATQAVTSQFAAHLREIATSAGVRLRLALECESFPQALGALRTGQYAAILPRLALTELDARAFMRSQPLNSPRNAAKSSSPGTRALSASANKPRPSPPRCDIA